MRVSYSRRHLKKVFSPDIGVEPLSQVLDILEYACGLILGLALISTENPNFEITSIQLKPLKAADFCFPPPVRHRSRLPAMPARQAGLGESGGSQRKAKN